jgi:hypothetical protein
VWRVCVGCGVREMKKREKEEKCWRDEGIYLFDLDEETKLGS